ncbi:MAG TPA: ABC transporter permease, partial [Actinomycetota bacterium]|nr:ABC transporter permease [Actinomycetota bacterium]
MAGPEADTEGPPPAPGSSPAFPRYARAKVQGALASLLAVAFTGFFIFRVLPGDPVRTITRGRPVSAA